MLYDAKNPITAEAKVAEILIIGAGAVGIALAVKLARSGRRVTLLEAGSVAPRADYQVENTGPCPGRPHRGILSGRMRALGDTTRLWGGQLVPFGRGDLESVMSDGRRVWPLSYDQLLPFFAEAFELLGVGKEGQDQEEVWRRATRMDPEFGGKLRLGMNIWLPEPDFSVLFGNEIRSLPTLQVITNMEVVRLQFGSTGEVSHVGARQPSSEVFRFAADQVVLANGTLEISRLLLRTAVLEPNCGFAGNTQIGQGYIDHLHGIAGEITVTDYRQLSNLFDNVYFEGRKYGVKLRAEDSFREERAISNCAGTMNAASTIRDSISELGALARRIGRGSAAEDLLPWFRQASAMTRIMVPVIWRYLVERRSYSLFTSGVYLGLEIEQISTSKSYLFLDPDTHPSEARIGIHWELSGREIDAAAEFCREVKEQFEKRGLGSIQIDPRIEARDSSFFDDCHDANHQMGGARMGESAFEGVVDRNLRVFGTDNLYVAGAAVFPSGSFANPTLTAIALAMRLADHLPSIGHRNLP